MSEPRTAATPTRDTSDTIRAALAEQLRKVRLVCEILESRARIRKSRAPDDDVAVLLGLIVAHVPAPFRVQDVLAADAATLRAALMSRHIKSKRQLGALFRDVHRRPVGAFRVTQCARDRYGCMWSIERL